MIPPKGFADNPVDLWLNGKVHEVELTDEVHPETFVAYLRYNCTRRHLALWVSVTQKRVRFRATVLSEGD